jgi:D-alanyl-lipoteichoic acid acyltransferase DltB (MBOAT superfamily)
MLFSSLEFIFLFLPLTGLAFVLLRRWHTVSLALGSLALASLVFYGWWKPCYLPLFLGSVVVNFFLGRCIYGPDRRSYPVLLLGLAANLGFLIYFKYASFLSEVAVQVGLGKKPFPAQLLPLGVSFFTFTQITYLVDRWRGVAPPTSFTRYLLFVSFFPHLIAGPVLHHAQMMPQLEKPEPTWTGFSNGLFLFAIGLAKKVVLADSLGTLVDAGFMRPAQLETIQAWQVLVAFAVQLYFDFSGYSDMAIGLGKMFGVDLPWNFDSPYKSTNLAEFWRRWHMTLSAFFKDYIYIPLGGSRCGPFRCLFNLFLTMLLAGIWHGAGWTFILWGALHGGGLATNHLWRRTQVRIPRLLGWWLTVAVVLLGWVLFRATSLSQALLFYHHLFAFKSAQDSGSIFVLIDETLFYVLLGLLLILACPNAKALAARYRPTLKWGACTAVLFALAMLFLLGNQKPQPEFLYFNF